MRKPNRLPPREPANDFDRMGWEICKFTSGSQTACVCERQRTRCCVQVEEVVKRQLSILTGKR